MTNRIRDVCTLILVALCASYGTGFAYQLKNLPPDKKTKLSAAIVVGIVTDVSNSVDFFGNPARYATLHVETTLKGSPSDYLKIRVTSEVAESRIDCCKVGGRYLFFLTQDKNDRIYEVLDGRFGFSKIESP
jgi:hypothetical protein